MEAQDFLERVFKKLPSASITSYQFQHWSFGGKPTDEGFGLTPIPGVDPERLIARVMDVDRYVGNVDHVSECRSVPDARFSRPEKVRFYQKVTIPVIGSVQHELVLVDAGTLHGYRVAYWYQLQPETDALNGKAAARSQYNVGAWLAAPGVVGYALSSAPRRSDVNFLQWQALTTGANVAAPKVVRENIEGMARWASRS